MCLEINSFNYLYTVGVKRTVLMNLASSTNTLRNSVRTMMLVSKEMLEVLQRLPKELVNKINSENALKILSEDSDAIKA